MSKHCLFLTWERLRFRNSANPQCQNKQQKQQQQQQQQQKQQQQNFKILLASSVGYRNGASMSKHSFLSFILLDEKASSCMSLQFYFLWIPRAKKARKTLEVLNDAMEWGRI